MGWLDSIYSTQWLAWISSWRDLSQSCNMSSTSTSQKKTFTLKDSSNKVWRKTDNLVFRNKLESTGNTAHPWSTLTGKTVACQNMSLNVFSRPLDKNYCVADSFQSFYFHVRLFPTGLAVDLSLFPTFMTLLSLKLVFDCRHAVLKPAFTSIHPSTHPSTQDHTWWLFSCVFCYIISGVSTKNYTICPFFCPTSFFDCNVSL